jgi:hypothetical protein
MAKQNRRPPQKWIFRDLTFRDPQKRIELHKTHAQPKIFLKLSDNILWPYKSAGGRNIPLPLDTDLSEIEAYNAGKEGAAVISYLPRQIRYVVGLNSPFADEQDSDATRRDANGQNGLLDNPANRDALMMVMGELKLNANDVVLGAFMWLSNQCENQHPKAQHYGSGRPLYYKVDFGEIDQQRVDMGKLRKEMYKYAETASLEEMLPHADYLGIPFIIGDTHEDRDWDAVREDYKERALDDPKGFQTSANNPKIKMMYIIKGLQRSGKISINNIMQGQAHWAETRKLISQLPPDREPIEYLAEYSLTTEGETFAKQMTQFKQFASLSL